MQPSAFFSFTLIGSTSFSIHLLLNPLQSGFLTSPLFQTWSHCGPQSNWSLLFKCSSQFSLAYQNHLTHLFTFSFFETLSFDSFLSLVSFSDLMFYFFSISFAEFTQSFRLLNIILSIIQSFYLCPFAIYTHTPLHILC